jgi:DNA-binding beta-propeller fold protein YncE
VGRASSAVAFMLALTALVAGCSSGGGPTGTRSTRSTGTIRSTLGPVPARVAISTRCGSQVAGEPSLGRVRTALLRLPGLPDGVSASPDGRWVFSSLQGVPGRIAVSSDQSFAPRLVRTVSLPAGDVSGLAVTRDGRLLLAASGRGAVVVSVARAAGGAADPMLGMLSAPSRGAAARGGGAEVAVSPDDRVAFVSLEGAGEIAVFDLRAARAGRFGHAFVGTIPVGIAPLGLAVSPDGRWLYATSEQARGRAGRGHGTLTVIDVQRAESDPARAVIATAAVPCHPVRVAASPDGRIVWVTARVGNELLGFSVAGLLSGRQRSPVAQVRVGEQPIGLAVVDGGRRVVVADSNLVGKRGATSRLTVVDAAAALRGAPALLGAVRTGTLPSEIGVSPNGKTLLVNNSSSGQLEAVDVPQIP